MKKYLGIVVLLFGIALGAFYYRGYMQPEPVAREQVDRSVELAENEVRVEIDFGNGEKVEATGEVVDGSTAYSVMKKLADEKRLVVDEKKYDFGVFVEGINGVMGSAEKGWIYFVNDVSGEIAADQQLVSAGDVVSWRYIESIY